MARAEFFPAALPHMGRVSAALRKKSVTTNQVSGAVRPTHSPKLVNAPIHTEMPMRYRCAEQEAGWGKVLSRSGRGARGLCWMTIKESKALVVPSSCLTLPLTCQ